MNHNHDFLLMNLGCVNEKMHDGYMWFQLTKLGDLPCSTVLMI